MTPKKTILIIFLLKITHPTKNRIFRKQQGKGTESVIGDWVICWCLFTITITPGSVIVWCFFHWNNSFKFFALKNKYDYFNNKEVNLESTKIEFHCLQGLSFWYVVRYRWRKWKKFISKWKTRVTAVWFKNLNKKIRGAVSGRTDMLSHTSPWPQQHQRFHPLSVWHCPFSSSYHSNEKGNL